MSKYVALLVIAFLTLPSLMIVESAFAQSIPKPSVPEFTLKYVDYSYDTSPTYGIDQFTGKTVVTDEGEHFDNRSVVFAIRNQPFIPYVDWDNKTIGLYYNFRYKGHFGNAWEYYTFSESGQSWRYGSAFFVFIEKSPYQELSASNSEYTDITLRLPFLFGYGKPPMGTQVDFQVQALIGKITYAGDGYYNFAGERSDWSNTQILDIPSSGSSYSCSSFSPSSKLDQPTETTPNQTMGSNSQETSQTWQSVAVLGVTVGLVVIASLLIYFKKHKHRVENK